MTSYLVGLAIGFAPTPLPRLSRCATASVSLHSAPLRVAAARAPPPRAFADQLDNLAGPLFAGSLFPYLAFLYFVRQDCNGLSPTAKAGFTSLLAFVTATIVTSIVAVKTFDTTLANVDFLHAGAEQLLSFTNVVNVVGLKLTLDGFVSGAVTQPAAPPADGGGGTKAYAAIAAAAAATLLGTAAASGFALDVHTPFLGGLGDLPDGLWPLGFDEPANALSIPTWLIHVSSLLEWLVAMGLVWRIGLASGNPRWQGMTWAMIPSHSSGVAACVYHVFYNSAELQSVVLLQAALTLLGNATLAFAAYRLAVSNGWTPPFVSPPADADADAPPTLVPPSLAVAPAPVAAEGLVGGIATVVLWSVLASYFVKYGETLLPITLEAPVWAAMALIAAPTALNVWKWNERSRAGGDFNGLI